MKLPIELLYRIIDICVESDVKSCQNILAWSTEITTVELLYLNRGVYSCIIQNSNYNKLRLWKLLCQIPRQDKPIQLAVGVSDSSWTILEVEVRNERIDYNKYENFLVLEEATKVYSEPRKWKKSYLYLQHQPSTKKKRSITIVKEDNSKILPFFELYQFLTNLNLFTTNNLMSIWLWKRSNTFFKKDILYNMINNNNNGFFRPILDTQQKSLMAWDRPILKENGPLLGLTETVMLYNTELFGRLL